MSHAVVVSLGFGAYLSALAVITWRSRRAGQRGRGFVLASRRVGVVGTVASQYVSITDGTGFIIFVTLGATMGLGLLWIGLGTSLPFLILAAQARRIRKLSGEQNYVTVSDMLRDRVGPRTATVSAVAIVVTMFLSMAGSMHISGGASAAYRREIEDAPDPEAKRAEIEARLEAIASPFRTAEATGQDIIDPRETRRSVVEFVRDSQAVLRTQLGPPPAPYRP